MRARGEHGQSAVELALALPILAVLALALVQLGLVVRDQLLVVHAARDAAREAAVTADPAAVATAARGATALRPERLDVGLGRRGPAGSRVRVELRYRSPTRVPLVGRLVDDVVLRAAAEMRVEATSPPPAERHATHPCTVCYV
jgi:hypothetical protein